MTEDFPRTRRVGAAGRAARGLAVVLVAAAAVLTGAPAVQAAAGSSPSPRANPSARGSATIPNYDNGKAQGGYATWSLVPVDARGQLDGRPKYSYTSAAGRTITDFMGISNFSLKPLTLAIDATDAINTSDGQFGLLPTGVKPLDIGSWVRIKRHVVTVPARSRISMPFVLVIPATATPGDHVAGITATAVQGRTGNKGQKVAVNFRTGSRLYLRVAGTLRPALVVERVRGSYTQNLNPVGHGAATITYRVRNVGNVRLSAHQRVSIMTPWGTHKSAPGVRDVPELLPGESADLVATVPGVLPVVLLQASVDLQPLLPRGVSAPPLHNVSGRDWFWAVPWSLIAVLVGLFVYWQVRRWRNRRRAGGPTAGKRRRGAPVAPAGTSSRRGSRARAGVS